MQRLFWKIFGWFWGAMVLIGLTFFFVVTTAQPDPLPVSWRDATTATLHSYALAASGIWEKQGQQKLAAYLDQQGVQMEGRFWLYYNQRELTNRPPGGFRLQQLQRPLDQNPSSQLQRQPVQQWFAQPAPVQLQQFPPPPGGPPPFGGPPPNGPPPGRPPGNFAPPPSGLPPNGPPPNAPQSPQSPNAPPFPSGDLATPPPPGPPRPQVFRELRERVLASGKTHFHPFGRRVLVTHRVQSATGKTYIMQGDLPMPRLGRPAAGPVRQAIGVLAMLLVSGLVCYGLVRYITSPLEKLRLATENFAHGDLTSRTGANTLKRRDEVADLGRDFDAMAERIEALVTAQRRLLGDISHELRSPLARLSMGLALARRSVAAGAPKEEIDSSLERIKRETVRLNSLIEQLLQWTRLEGDSAQLPRENLRLDELLQDVVADTDFEGQATQRKVVLLRTAPCTIHGSPDLLRSAIENILRNALRYTPPGTRIEASLDVISAEDFWQQNTVQTARATALITIRDYGAGVPETALSEIFKPFYRVAEARDRATGGVGLGLAITERAVRSHGGSIRALNARGGGLQVEIRLPALK